MCHIQTSHEMPKNFELVILWYFEMYIFWVCSSCTPSWQSYKHALTPVWNHSYLPSFIHTELYNKVTIQGSSSPWLAGNSYTLTCVATTDITPQVKWTDPSGNPVVEGEGLTLSGPAVFGGNTTLRLTFNYLRTSQAGRYSCLSIIASPTSVQSEVWDTTVQSESDNQPVCTTT